MCAHKVSEERVAAASPLLAWLAGERPAERRARHERSAHLIAGVVVALGALVAWLVAGLAVGESAHWPVAAVVASSLVFGLLVGAVTRAVASGQARGRPSIMVRGAVALAVGVVVGELAALVLLSGPIDRRLDEQAARRADAAPAVVQAAAALDQTRRARTALDDTVDQARRHRDEALVVARCEYNPSPACPQTRITGVPGTGPETRTAEELLADSQRELDEAVAVRDRRAPGLDTMLADGEQALAQARQHTIADPDRGLGSRWVAMHDLTLANPGALLLRLLTIVFCMLLYLLPLLLRLWRGETTQDRRAAADAERERAEIEAETKIAVKRAEVRAAAESLWAEHQLAAARFAVEAQTEIDRAQQRRRVAEALETAVPTPSQVAFEPVDDDIYLPIAAEAEAASRAAMQLPASAPEARDEPQHLPAAVESDAESGNATVSQRGAPIIPEVTRAAARWIRPLVPTLVARAIDTTTQPLRAARQVFEEVEEITFSLKRTRKVTVDSEESLRPPRQRGPAAGGEHREAQSPGIFSAERGYPDFRPVDAGAERPSPAGLPGREPGLALEESERLGELGPPEGPRQLPPGK